MCVRVFGVCVQGRASASVFEDIILERFILAEPRSSSAEVNRQRTRKQEVRTN